MIGSLIFTLIGAANASCPALHIGAGTIDTGGPLPVSAELSEADRACLAQVGARLAARPGVRTVTVAVRLPDGQRLGGEGVAIGEAYAAAIAAGGISAARISSVVPAAGPGEGAQIALTFTEKQSVSRVAVTEAVSGEVLSGPDTDSLAPLSAGALISANTWLQTGPDATAALALADGSRVSLQPEGLLRIGALRVNEQLQRIVELELSAGTLDTDVSPGGAGSRFEVTTRTGVAGVRGTEFRLAVEDDASRLETLEGTVALVGSPPQASAAAAAEVLVEQGFGSRVDSSGVPATPSALPPAPVVKAPLDGSWSRSGAFRWKPVDGASGYVVQLARDAEFLLDVSRLNASEPTTVVESERPAGTWFWRVAAVDAQGFIGAWSKVYAFELGD